MKKSIIDRNDDRNKFESIEKENGETVYSGHVVYNESVLKFSVVADPKKAGYKTRGRVYAVDETGGVLKKEGPPRNKIIKNYLVKVFRIIFDKEWFDEICLELPQNAAEEMELVIVDTHLEKNGNPNKTRLAIENDNDIMNAARETFAHRLKPQLLQDCAKCFAKSKKQISIVDSIDGNKTKYRIPERIYEELIDVIRKEKNKDLYKMALDELGASNQMFDCTCDIYVKTTDPEDIKDQLTKKIVEIYNDNKNAITKNLAERIKADNITPQLAVSQYGKAFLKVTSRGNADTINKSFRALSRTVSKISEKPMSVFTEKEMAADLRKGGVSEAQIKKLSQFWMYCLRTGKCNGVNPVPQDVRKKTKPETRQKQATRITILALDQQIALYDYLHSHHTKYSVGITLMAATGLPAREIVQKKYGDIIVHSEKEMDLIHIIDEFGYTKNYTAPIIPLALDVIYEKYDSLLSANGPEKMKKIYVVSNGSKNTPVSADRLNKEAKKVLDVLFARDASFENARKLESTMAAPSVIFSQTLHNNLIDICNLTDEDGTVSFLEKKSLAGNITADNYVSYVSPEGRDRLRCLLKCICKDEKIHNTVEQIEGEDNRHIMRYYPSHTHASVRMTGTIIIGPHDKVIIKSDHSIEGPIIRN